MAFMTFHILGMSSSQLTSIFFRGVGIPPTSYIPSGKHTKNYGKSPFLMGKSTISMAMFNSYVSLPEGNWCIIFLAPTYYPGCTSEPIISH